MAYTQAELDAIKRGQAYTGTGTAAVRDPNSTRTRPPTTGITEQEFINRQIAMRDKDSYMPTPAVENNMPIQNDNLLASLRRSLLTGAQVQSGARTFGSGSAFGNRFNKNAASLRIGKTRTNMARREEIKRRKQTNTLGLSLGSSVGLQV